MWRIKKQNYPVPGQDTVTVIEHGCELEGNFRFPGTLVLEGKLKGKVVYGDALIVRDSGVLEADCCVKSIVLEGQLKGDVTVRERMEMRSTARAVGNISTPLLVVDEGATLTGEVKIKGQPGELNFAIDEEPEPVGTIYAPLVVVGCSLS